MLPLVLLILAIASALISRFLLLRAAFGLSVWWGLGIFFPFGPIFFRLCHPEEARQARLFGLAALALTFFYLLSAPSIVPTGRFGTGKSAGAITNKFTLPFRDHLFFGAKPTPLPTPAPTPTLAERRAANAKELAQLRQWNEQLRIKKRDLLHSDVDGNRQYESELASYNAAYTRAVAEHTVLSAQK